VRFGFARTGRKLHPLRGIDVDAVDVQNPVKMRAGGAASRTGVTEDVTALNLCARRGNQLGHVEVHRLETLAMVKTRGVTEDVELLSESYRAGGNRADGFAGGRALIDAAVIFAGGLAVVEAFDAEGRGHAARDGRSERVLPKTRVGDFFLERGQ
jgi:hypothetical protein